MGLISRVSSRTYRQSSPSTFQKRPVHTPKKFKMSFTLDLENYQAKESTDQASKMVKQEAIDSASNTNQDIKINKPQDPRTTSTSNLAFLMNQNVTKNNEDNQNNQNNLTDNDKNKNQTPDLNSANNLTTMFDFPNNNNNNNISSQSSAFGSSNQL